MTNFDKLRASAALENMIDAWIAEGNRITVIKSVDYNREAPKRKVGRPRKDPNANQRPSSLKVGA